MSLGPSSSSSTSFQSISTTLVVSAKPYSCSTAPSSSTSTLFGHVSCRWRCVSSEELLKSCPYSQHLSMPLEFFLLHPCPFPLEAFRPPFNAVHEFFSGASHPLPCPLSVVAQARFRWRPQSLLGLFMPKNRCCFFMESLDWRFFTNPLWSPGGM